MKLPTSAPILKEEDDKKDEEKKGKVKNFGERERIKKDIITRVVFFVSFKILLLG